MCRPCAKQIFYKRDELWELTTWRKKIERETCAFFSNPVIIRGKKHQEHDSERYVITEKVKVTDETVDEC